MSIFVIVSTKQAVVLMVDANIQREEILPALKLGSLKVRKTVLIEFTEKYEGMDLSDLDNIKEI